MQCIVIIVCPKTGQEVPTGIVTDIRTFAELPKGESKLECTVCGEVHTWSATDAMLAISSNVLVAGRR